MLTGENAQKILGNLPPRIIKIFDRAYVINHDDGAFNNYFVLHAISSDGKVEKTIPISDYDYKKNGYSLVLLVSLLTSAFNESTGKIYSFNESIFKLREPDEGSTPVYDRKFGYMFKLTPVFADAADTTADSLSD